MVTYLFKDPAALVAAWLQKADSLRDQAEHAATHSRAGQLRIEASVYEACADQLSKTTFTGEEKHT